MKIPKAFADAQVQVIAKPVVLEPVTHQGVQLKAATQVKARIDMSDDVAGRGLCPECRKPMRKVFSAGLPTVVCMPCRITLPLSDSGDQAPETALDLAPFRF